MCITTENIVDTASGANFDDVSIRHLHLNLKVSFEEKVFHGVAELNFTVHNNTDKIILDSRDLKINSIVYLSESLKFITNPNGVMGQTITIVTPLLTKGSEGTLKIHYTTDPDASALQFISKEQTIDKKAPYLYSQCQPCHARSIVPCMDTPSVKQTYTANVFVPKGFTVLMSAISNGECKNKDENCNAYSFYQPIPIPSYLLAIVVGYLEKRDISDRCAVWSEASIIDKAHNEFIDTEKMLTAAEEVLGPYKWGRYDLVVLPETFPFGGMENPCCTFVTPTLLAGDKSLTNVIAHEIAHSWTGNTVTNANWEHFWLNEGFTVFAERKIIGRLNGENMRQFEALSGWESRLTVAVNEVFGPHHEFTKLIPNLNGVDPDDAFSTIPYEKGSALLMYLEQIIGNFQRFEQFIRDYIIKYEGKSITSYEWKDFLYDYFHDMHDVLNKVDFEKWFNSPGMPPNTPVYEGSLMSRCRRLANNWIDATDECLDKPYFAEANIFNSMSSAEKDTVLDYIRQSDKKISIKKVEKLTELYKLDETENCEIIMSWLRIGLKAEWEDIIDPTLKFVTKYGRIKYIKPLYNILFSWPPSKDRAIETFKKNKPYMHPITAHVVEQMLPRD
uniref:Leuk-A4-hydro_C domain-containing protein n=1 Tax=Strongyloides papillosus TaxID=174720 RepID=A0A0N5BUD8_STREA